MGLMPAASRAAIISKRPLVARCEGKNPRLPTTTPIVICLPIVPAPCRGFRRGLLPRYQVTFVRLRDNGCARGTCAAIAVRSSASGRFELDRIEQAEDEQQQAPPERWVEVVEHCGGFVVADPLPRTVRREDEAVQQCECAYKKPDGEFFSLSRTFCHAVLPDAFEAV